MRIPQDQLFRDEQAQFLLKWNCEDCALFNAQTLECIHAYPTHRHRKSRYADPAADLLFCKDFELA